MPCTMHVRHTWHHVSQKPAVTMSDEICISHLGVAPVDGAARRLHLAMQVGAVKAFSGEDLNYLGVAGFRVAGGQGIAIIAICQVQSPCSCTRGCHDCARQ